MNCVTIKRLALLSAALAQSACVWWGGPTEQSRIPRDATVYQCENGKTLAVRYDGNRSAMIIFPEREFRLDKLDGAAQRYSNGTTMLTVENGIATLEEARVTTFPQCKPRAS